MLTQCFTELLGFVFFDALRSHFGGFGLGNAALFGDLWVVSRCFKKAVLRGAPRQLATLRANQCAKPELSSAIVNLLFLTIEKQLALTFLFLIIALTGLGVVFLTIALAFGAGWIVTCGAFAGHAFTFPAARWLSSLTSIKINAIQHIFVLTRSTILCHGAFHQRGGTGPLQEVGDLTMTTIYTIHAPTAGHLEAVKAQMLTLGAPVIRVINCGDYYMAVEGSHRIAAAHALGLTPELVVIEQDEILDISQFDWYEPENWGGTHYPAGEVAGELYSPYQARDYSFAD